MIKMSIHDDVKNLEQLNIEIKRLRARLRILNNEKKECEERIMIFLDENDQPGVKYNGMTIVSTRKTKRRHIKKKEKIDNGEDILRKYGIRDSKRALEELMEAMRGEQEETNSLRIL